MQKIRNLVNTPLSLTRLVVGAGVILFLTGVILLLVGNTQADVSMSRLNLFWAGWVLTVGWILKRVEDRQWPFPMRRPGHPASSGPTRTNILVITAALLGAMIWRSYGPLGKEAAPVPAPNLSHARLTGARNLVPYDRTDFRITGYSRVYGGRAPLYSPDTYTPRTGAVRPPL
jgi:hypothetical protein